MLFVLLAGTACAKKSSQEITIRGGASQPQVQSSATKTTGGLTHEIKTFKTPQEASAALSGTTLVCEDTSTCLPAVGAFLQKDGSTLRSCTAFLVSEDVAVISEHCLMESSFSPSYNCSEIIFKFAKTSQFPEEQISCKKIQRTSRELKAKMDKKIDAASLPDFAFIQLTSKTKRPFLTLASEPHVNEEQVKIQKVDFGAVGEFSVLREVQCQVTTLVPLLYTNLPQGPLIRLKNCEAHHGNSGAPVLSATGKVIGILKSALSKDEPAPAVAPTPKKSINSFATAVSAACLIDMATGCSYDEKLNTDILNEVSKDKHTDAKKQAYAEMDKYSSQNSQTYHWKKKTGKQDDLISYMVLVPECQIEKSKNQVDVFDMAWWILKKDVNSDFEQDVAVKTEIVKARLGLSTGTELVLNYRNPVTNSIVNEKIKLPICE